MTLYESSEQSLQIINLFAQLMRLITIIHLPYKTNALTDKAKPLTDEADALMDEPNALMDEAKVLTD